MTLTAITGTVKCLAYLDDDYDQTTTESHHVTNNNNQEDVVLVRDLLSKMIPPATNNFDYTFLQKPDNDKSAEQARMVRLLTNYKRDGFFVECGAGDGEFLSTTLYLERFLNWTGLLVEANPIHSIGMVRSYRRAWRAPVCMSINTSAFQGYFPEDPAYFGQILLHPRPYSRAVPCYPFYTFLLALNITSVDFFSLNVSGDELNVLRTVPFHRIDIAVVTVSFLDSPRDLLAIITEMHRNGYKPVSESPPGVVTFVKNDHFNKLNEL